MIGYFWPHVFESGGADQLVVRSAENDQQLHQRLTKIVARLARDGATRTTVLQSCPLQYVPVLEVVADALLDTGAVNSVDFSAVTDEEERFSLSISARDPADAVIVGAACDWARPDVAGFIYDKVSLEKPTYDFKLKNVIEPLRPTAEEAREPEKQAQGLKQEWQVFLNSLTAPPSSDGTEWDGEDLEF